MQVQADIGGVAVAAHGNVSDDCECDDVDGGGGSSGGGGSGGAIKGQDHTVASEASLGAALAAALGAGVISGPERLHAVPLMGSDASSVRTYRVTTTSLQRVALVHRWHKALRHNSCV